MKDFFMKSSIRSPGVSEGVEEEVLLRDGLG